MVSKIVEQLMGRHGPLLDQNRSEYHEDIETPHIVFEDFLDRTLAKQVASEFPPVGDTRWTHNYHFNERKMGYDLNYDLPPSVKKLVEALSSKAFIEYLKKLTKIDGLVPDVSHSKALHYALSGGFINLHMDPNVHPGDRQLKRQVNLLLYLNENWEESYGGELQIWDRSVTKCIKKILPTFNRCVIFNTMKIMHGFPDAIKCPEDDGRKAVVLYYFTRESNDVPIKITDYKARPCDPLPVKIKVFCGRVLLHIFYFLRDHLNFKQEYAGQITKFMESALDTVRSRKD